MSIVRRHASTILAAALLIAVGACGPDDRDDRPVLVVSILPQASLVERIAGDRFRIVVLVEPGQSPATYTPSDYQVSEVARAKVYFRIGVPFERGSWLEAIAGSGSAVRVVDTSRDVEKRHLDDHDGHDHGGADPHCWLVPAGLRAIGSTIAATLVDLDPEHAEDYRANLAGLQRDLDALDAEIRSILAPHRGRRLYVFHPSWGYLCDAHGLEQIAIEVDGKSPSDSEITALVRQARADGTRAIHVQPQFRGTAAAAIAGRLGLEVRLLDPLARDPLENLRDAARSLADGWR